MLNLVRSVIKSTNVRSIITAPSAISNAKLMEAPEVKFEVTNPFAHFSLNQN
jgi:hypothetical protein